MNAVIICGISAWQYWRTPPVLREGIIPLELASAPRDAGGLGLSAKTFTPRANARDAERLILPRLLGELKGVSLPVHVMVDEPQSRRKSNYIAYHRTPMQIAREHLHALSQGLYVTTPTFTLCQGQITYDRVLLARAICEACGLYATAPQNALVNAMMDRALSSNKVQNSEGCTHFAAYTDNNGKRASFTTPKGKVAPWEYAHGVTIGGTNLWKRPPLTSCEELRLLCDHLQGAKGIKTVRSALALAHDGLGSPLETQGAIMLFPSCRSGGFELPVPAFNQRIDLSPEAKSLSTSASYVGDMVWKEQRTILEIDGKGYHANADQFARDSRRTAALQNMGYAVYRLNYEQLSDLNRLIAATRALCKALGATIVETHHSYDRQARLHEKVFSRSPLEQ